jgi:hypothetical protein
MTSIRNSCTRHAAQARRLAQRLRAARPWGASYDRLAASRGQGTVEYIGIVVVVGALLLAVKTGLGDEIGKTVAHAITQTVTDAIDQLSTKKKP